MKLIICEKPSVGMAIASALGIETKKDGYIEGKDFLVSWCIGHLAELSQPSCYGRGMLFLKTGSIYGLMSFLFPKRADPYSVPFLYFFAFFPFT